MNHISIKEISALKKELSDYAVPSKSLYETITTQGKPLIDIGEHVESWILEKHCFIFEDKELIASFAHYDKQDFELIEAVIHMYHNELSNFKTKH